MLSLQMDSSRAEGLPSPSQQAKHVTEDWARRQLYCLSCGERGLHYVNKPVLDFQCENCGEKYELKSKKGKFGDNVLNSAYSKKIEAINAQVNPSFLFLQYDRPTWKVTDLFALPRFLFFGEMIRARKPLRESAQRAGWVGSIMLLGKLPPDSKVYVVRDSGIVPETEVRQEWASLCRFQNVPPRLRGWALDVWNQIKNLPDEFTLSEAYHSEDTLRSLHPKNRHIREKIRQQLQCLRDAGLVAFEGKGQYRMQRKTTQESQAHLEDSFSNPTMGENSL